MIQTGWSKAEGVNDQRCGWGTRRGMPVMIQKVWSKAEGVNNKNSMWNKARRAAGNDKNRLE